MLEDKEISSCVTLRRKIKTRTHLTGWSKTGNRRILKSQKPAKTDSPFFYKSKKTLRKWLFKCIKSETKKPIWKDIT